MHAHISPRPGGDSHRYVSHHFDSRFLSSRSPHLSCTSDTCPPGSHSSKPACSQHFPYLQIREVLSSIRVIPAAFCYSGSRPLGAVVTHLIHLHIVGLQFPPSSTAAFLVRPGVCATHSPARAPARSSQILISCIEYSVSSVVCIRDKATTLSLPGACFQGV